jgi:hypothetical protein
MTTQEDPPVVITLDREVARDLRDMLERMAGGDQSLPDTQTAHRVVSELHALGI